jgi:hypothetical protein
MKATEIPTSRWKTLCLMGVCLAFVAIGVSLLPESGDDDRVILYCGNAFFGLGVLVAGWQLIRPHRLLLDSDGFILLGGLTWWPKKIYWHDIDKFFVYRLSQGGKMIGFNYKPGAEKSGWARISRSFGADGGLPTDWVLSPEQVVDELNLYRSHADGDVGPKAASISN